jgi:O-antigen ligase
VKRSDEAALFALSAWVLVSSRLTHRALRAHGIGIIIAACYLAMIASSVLAGAQLLPSLLDLALFSKPFLLFAVGTSIVLAPQEIDRGLGPALLMMLIVVLFAVVFMVFPALQDSYIGDIRGPDVRVGLVSAQGFFDGPGPYSWFCAATFAIAYAAYLSFNKTFYLYAACIGGVFTLIAWRRKSIIGVVAMLILATILHGRLTTRSRLRALVIVILVAALAATVLAPYLGGLWVYTVTEYATDPYSTARFALHYTSVLIAVDHFPFGTGLASFASHASRVYYSDVYHRYGLANIWGLSPQYPEFITDTFWPMVLGEGGVLALVAYFCFFLLLAKHFWAAARRTDVKREHRFLLLAAFFLLIGSISESTSSHIYDSTMQSALVMIPVGMCWSSLAVQRATEADLRASSLRRA